MDAWDVHDEGDGYIVIPKQVGTWLVVVWVVGAVVVGSLAGAAVMAVAALLPG